MRRYKLLELISKMQTPDSDIKAELIHGKASAEADEAADEEKLEKILKDTLEINYVLDLNSIIAITDKKGIITYVNQKFCEISKYSREELIGQNHRIINSGYHPRDFFAHMWKTIASGKTWKGDIKNKAKDGTHYWVETVITPILGEDGKPVEYIAIRTDITNRKRYEQQIKDALHEKEVLLAEIHHRVKNNMAIISGFLMLQSLTVSDPKMQALFEDSQNRIKTMALIHEKLYQSETFNKINFRVYIEDLIKYLSLSFNKADKKIQFDVKVEEIYFDITTAVPVGLILNELITNAFKYAFAGRSEGTIRIAIIRFDSKYRMTVSDDGVGLAPGFEVSKIRSLGLSLVHSLAH